MDPTIGRIVLFKLTKAQAEQVNRRRLGQDNVPAIVDRVNWPVGAQAHVGHPAAEGDTSPMIVTRVWADLDGVNGQVFLDGNDVLWVTSALEGTEPGTWAWPQKG